MDTRPPPPGPPPRYNFMQKVYRYNLRPVALTCGVMAWLWTLLWSIRSFQDAGGDRTSFPRVVAFDITLGALYATACAIETFGVFAMFGQKTRLVGIYSWASVGAVIVVIAAELIRIILHFTLKKSLIDQCTRENTGDVVITRGGFWDPTTSTTLTEADARNWCNDAWNRGTFADFAWFILSALLGFMFVSVNFAYWRQLLDPTSVVSRYPRAPSEQYGMGAIPHQPQPYNPYAQQQYNPYSYGQPDPFARNDYAPPYDAQKLPGYGSHGFDNQELRDDKDPNGPKPQA
ncbi:hypothetical protein RhiJN_13025 [Ceratobasidium sp. AG-Ba]|nr:hypothetical protein RhiJN_13025 [Ceratobasidium sp. AG-Ba]QRW13586.1 hypothetical protein RhiLY_12585 [Ceratobasidium sp. AG-Ba]